MNSGTVGSPAELPWQEALYRQLHENPEMPMQEVETRAEIARRLADYGFEVHEIGGGIVGVLTNGDGPTVLFRADIDALPVQEDTGLPYASRRDGVMHACGHDLHIVCALGAAQVLAGDRDNWAGTYVALFQPGEETAQGARAMVADGLVDKIPRPDVALAQHVLTAPPAGCVATAPGPVLSAGDSIKITISGVGSHGSMPHLGVDPVVVAACVVLRLQTIVSRTIAPGEFGVVTVGSISAGTKSNIIPAQATLLVNVRAYDLAVRERMLAAIERIVRGECAAAGCPTEPTFEFYDQYPMTDNDPQVDARVRAALQARLGKDRVADLPRIPASEDFSIIPDAFGIPYTYWGLGGFTADQTPLPNHNPGFAPAVQPTIATGTEAALAGALAWLGREVTS